MDNQNNNRIRIELGQARKVNVLASDIIKKFRTKQDRIAFCKENSKLFLLIFRFIFSR